MNERMIARRAALRRSGVALAALAGLWPASRGAAQQKVSKIDAKYQDRPNGQQRCQICLQFEPAGSCKLVEGKISPQGWCQFFAARENAH
jgi:hypothetical protein